MGFSKKEYRIYKKYMDEQLRTGFYLNPEVYTSLKDKEPWVRVDITLDILAAMIHAENFEAAQAIVDSLKEWFNGIGYPIPENAKFNIKEYAPEHIYGHISYVRCKKSGL